jgi:predicted peptidase
VFQSETRHSFRVSYLLFLPADYRKNVNVRWPLILYLHGGSLRGTDVNQVRSLGLPHKLESEPNFPFIVVSPQCLPGEIWTDVEALSALLDRVKTDYRIDPDRIYVTGHSMGGRGALYLAYRLPERFAAILALSPLSPITAWKDNLAKIPLWIFHGKADNLAPVAETEELVRGIEATGGIPVWIFCPSAITSFSTFTTDPTFISGYSSKPVEFGRAAAPATRTRRCRDG